MGHGKIGVSDFALTVSAAIRAQMGIRRISDREIAKLIDRGATYVDSRIKDENEWALGDIEKLCELWNMTPCELIESVNTEQSRVAETLNKPKRNRAWPHRTVRRLARFRRHARLPGIPSTGRSKERFLSAS